MKLTSIITKEAIQPRLEARDRSQVLQELSHLIEKVEPGLKAGEVYTYLEEREKLGSTGIGSGVAIPHGKIPSAKRMVGCFGRSVE